MDILQQIRQEQDIKAMNKRLIENAIKLYAEKTHFVYELLQNAEDAGATRVCFFQFSDCLEVWHDGKPFTKSNLQSLCDAANSDKVTQIDKIGKFGIGFKSVFAICSIVDLYSEPNNRPIENALPRISVRIEDYITPNYINDVWNPPAPYTTRFVFHYDTSLYGKSIESLRADISKKLRNLGSDVLLFMKNINEIDYLIDGIDTKSAAKGSYMLDRQEIGNGICKVTALGETDNNADDNSYLVFSKRLEPTERTIDIAYSIKEETGKIEFVQSASPYVSVYFPTETESKLNYIVQAPFDLTPNRSSLERDSERNAELVKMLSVLFRESIIEIKNRNWLTLSFLNLLPYDYYNPAFNPQWHFYLMHKAIGQMLTNEAIIPTLDGSYVKIKDAKIQRSAKLLTLFEGEYLCNFLNNSNAKWLPKDFTENSSLKAFHSFLLREGAEEIGSNELPKLLRANPDFLKNAGDDWLASFYDYLANDVKNLLGKNGDLATVPFVKTSDGNINAPFVTHRKGRGVEIEANIYKKPSNIIYSIEGFLFVDEFVSENCRDFVEALGLPEPDNFDYFVRELEIGKSAETIDDNVNLAQVKQAIKYLRAGHDNAVERFLGLLWIKVTKPSGESCFTVCSQSIYRERDYNGVPLKDYFLKVDCGAYILNEQFYLDGGLSLADIAILEQLGINNSVYENIDKNYWRDGNADCYNKEDFRKLLTFCDIRYVLASLRNCHYKNEYTLVKSKSAIIFSLLQNVEKHLQGRWQYRSTNPLTRDGDADIISELKDKWLLTTAGVLVSPSQISKYDLDEKIYGKIDRKNKIYEILGFKKTDDDKQEELVNEFFSRYTKEQRESIIKRVIPEETEIIFDPDVDEKYEKFPEESVGNLQRLKDKIKEWYPKIPYVKYEKVLRSIRTSRDRDKEYVKHRYNGYCQLCEDPSPYWEVAEIFNNPKREWRQMNLSLCPNCASLFRRLRNDSVIMQKFHGNIVDAELNTNPLRITLGNESIRFTKLHLAEVQEILKLEKQDTR